MISETSERKIPLTVMPPPLDQTAPANPLADMYEGDNQHCMPKKGGFSIAAATIPTTIKHSDGSASYKGDAPIVSEYSSSVQTKRL